MGRLGCEPAAVCPAAVALPRSSVAAARSAGGGVAALASLAMATSARSLRPRQAKFAKMPFSFRKVAGHHLENGPEAAGRGSFRRSACTSMGGGVSRCHPAAWQLGHAHTPGPAPGLLRRRCRVMRRLLQAVCCLGCWVCCRLSNVSVNLGCVDLELLCCLGFCGNACPLAGCPMSRLLGRSLCAV